MIYYFYNPIYCKTVLIYFVHQIICFEYYNKGSYFISIKLRDVTVNAEEVFM